MIGIDPFASTCKWLERAFSRIKSNDTIGWYQLSADITNSDQKPSSLDILHEAYCELLLWNPKYTFPEVII